MAISTADARNSTISFAAPVTAAVEAEYQLSEACAEAQVNDALYLRYEPDD